MISSQKTKELRDKTGISMMVCRKALEESGGDEGKAVEWLKRQGITMAEKKSSRATKSGLIESYVHAGGKAGVLLELRSETDFVAKNPLFKEAAHNIAMHVSAMSPADASALLEQPFIKDPNIKVADYINQIIQKFGENIEIGRFERFEI